MSSYAVKKVDVLSVLKILPIVFAIVGTVIGIFTFFVFPTDVASTLSAGQRFIAWVIFLVIYTALMVVGCVAVLWLYNVIVEKFGSAVTISLVPRD
jgi:hypothetical protein